MLSNIDPFYRDGGRENQIVEKINNERMNKLTMKDAYDHMLARRKDELRAFVGLVALLLVLSRGVIDASSVLTPQSFSELVFNFKIFAIILFVIWLLFGLQIEHRNYGDRKVYDTDNCPKCFAEFLLTAWAFIYPTIILGLLVYGIQSLFIDVHFAGNDPIMLVIAFIIGSSRVGQLPICQ